MRVYKVCRVCRDGTLTSVAAGLMHVAEEATGIMKLGVDYRVGRTTRPKDKVKGSPLFAFRRLGQARRWAEELRTQRLLGIFSTRDIRILRCKAEPFPHVQKALNTSHSLMVGTFHHPILKGILGDTKGHLPEGTVFCASITPEAEV